MKILIAVIFVITALTVAMAWEYKSNYQYKPAKSERHYNNGGQIYLQKGYVKKDGTYVEPHFKTKPDTYKWNNLKQDGDNE